MSGHLHHIARWLRLGLASLALAMGAVPAHALPSATAAVVTLSVEQRESTPQRAAAKTPAPSLRAVGHAPPRIHAQASSAARIPETHPPGPPRRLFVVHRALLH